MLLALTVGISKSATRIAISYLGSMIRNCSIGERKRLGVRKRGEINTLRSPSPRVRERICIYVYMYTKREGGTNTRDNETTQSVRSNCFSRFRSSNRLPIDPIPSVWKNVSRYRQPCFPIGSRSVIENVEQNSPLGLIRDA